jgi:hypothetical protein
MALWTVPQQLLAAAGAAASTGVLQNKTRDSNVLAPGFQPHARNRGHQVLCLAPFSRCDSRSTSLSRHPFEDCPLARATQPKHHNKQCTRKHANPQTKPSQTEPQQTPDTHARDSLPKFCRNLLLDNLPNPHHVHNICLCRIHNDPRLPIPPQHIKSPPTTSAHFPPNPAGNQRQAAMCHFGMRLPAGSTAAAAFLASSNRRSMQWLCSKCCHSRARGAEKHRRKQPQGVEWAKAQSASNSAASTQFRHNNGKAAVMT